MVKRVLIGGALVVLLLVGGVGAWLYSRNEPRPVGVAGPAADELARRMERAVNIEAWGRTGAVRWRFGGNNSHLWDRQRGLSEVRWGDERVLLRLADRSGLAFHAGLPLSAGDAQRYIDKAYRYFINDSFWLNPVAKLFDPGVVRERVEMEGGPALLVRYTSGGLTPGDAYLWLLGEDGLPRAWKMWVKIIPVGGVEASWERWQTLSTGAKISTMHKVGPRILALTDVEGAGSLSELTDGEDPFAPLFAAK